MSDKPIKSVRRVFEIFELFGRARRPLSAKEVADTLDYPLASSHALMKSMHQLGYADFDGPNWTYLPTRKFSLLSDWIADFVDREKLLLECVDALNHETKETINLSRLVRPNVKIVYGLECLHPIGVSVQAGTLMPATGSLTGVTMLASLSENRLASFFSSLAYVRSDYANEEAHSRLVAEVRSELADRGTVTRNDLFVQGIGAVCVAVQTPTSGESMVIGVVGPSERITEHAEAHRRALKRVLTKFGVTSHFTIRNPRKAATTRR